MGLLVIRRHRGMGLHGTGDGDWSWPSDRAMRASQAPVDASAVMSAVTVSALITTGQCFFLKTLLPIIYLSINRSFGKNRQGARGVSILTPAIKVSALALLYLHHSGPPRYAAWPLLVVSRLLVLGPESSNPQMPLQQRLKVRS